MLIEHFNVIPAKAGIQFNVDAVKFLLSPKAWIPAFAGMTEMDETVIRPKSVMR